MDSVLEWKLRVDKKFSNADALEDATVLPFNIMLPRECRLPNELLRVIIKKGLFVFTDSLHIKYYLSNNSTSRFAIVIPKKIIKLATVRNRNKRLLRQALFTTQHNLAYSIDAVVTVKKPQTLETQKNMNELVEYIFKKIR